MEVKIQEKKRKENSKLNDEAKQVRPEKSKLNKKIT
jgi:hypothetical protein